MAKGFELEGTIIQIDDIQTFASGFTKREFVVEVQDGNYPQQIKFECVKDRTALTDGHSVGDTVKVAFDIRGNEYKGRYYVNLNAWRVEKPDGGESGGSAQGGDQTFDEGAPPSHLNEPPASGADDDDIPF